MVDQKLGNRILLLFLVLLPVSGQCQSVFESTHGEWEGSIFAGGSFIGSTAHQTPVSGSNQGPSRAVGLSYGSGSQMGARLANNRWEHWGVAFEYGFSNQPITFTNLSDSTPSLGLGHAIHRFAYDVLYYPLDRHSRWRPFAFGGPGISLFYVKGSAKESAAAQGIRLNDPWKFTARLGGGVKYLLRDQVAVSLQFSDSISGVPGYGLPVNASAASESFVPGFRPDGLLHNWLISLGFVYQWDER